MTTQMQTLKVILAQLAPLSPTDQTELVQALVEIFHLRRAPSKPGEFRILGQGGGSHETLHGAPPAALPALGSGLIAAETGDLDPNDLGLLDVEHAARELGVTREAAYVIIHRSKIEITRKGRAIYVKADDIARLKAGRIKRAPALAAKDAKETRSTRSRSKGRSGKSSGSPPPGLIRVAGVGKKK